MYYKLQGEEAENGYDLAKNDFSLVVQTPFQWEMLLKFAQNGICCDSTQDTNGYDFLLTTIHVIDEFGEGVPATWCISSQDVLTTMVIFMNEIKKRCGNIHSQFSKPVLQCMDCCHGIKTTDCNSFVHGMLTKPGKRDCERRLVRFTSLSEPALNRHLKTVLLIP